MTIAIADHVYRTLPVHLEEVATDGYRWRLGVSWQDFTAQDGRLAWIMLNPSTAGVERGLDATMRRVVDFTRAAGYAACSVVNLYAYRATDPSTLWKMSTSAAIGTGNDSVIYCACMDAAAVVFAWGAGSRGSRSQDVLAKLRIIERGRGFCLGTTAKGQPRHPLMVTTKQALVPYEAAHDALRDAERSV